MSDHDRARDLWEQGTRHLMEGEVEEAIRLFEQSIAVMPTAEGYTYRGWARSYQGRLDEAIADCHTAIRLDPDFGNPYNDIGVYLMQQGRLDEAIPWLQRAKKAPRYEPRHFPYTNLAGIFERKGRWREAIAEFQAALQIQPGLESAIHAIARLRARMN